MVKSQIFVPLFRWASSAAMEQLQAWGIDTGRPDVHDPTVLALAFVFWSPYLYYTWLWFTPGPFCRFAEARGQDPSLLMSRVAHVLKVVQAVGVWIILPKPVADSVNDLDTRVGWPVVAVCLVLVATGQILNGAVYRSLGIDGTYYGVRFGKHVPWCTSFPYNLEYMRDPQYVGAILSIAGLTPLLKIPGAWAGWGVLGYLFMMVVENAERTPRHKPASGKTRN